MHSGHDHDHPQGFGGAGHNHAHAPARVVQWQKPHLAHDHDHTHDDAPHEPDLDLVEMAFVEGFSAAKDPLSFLRLARIPTEAAGSSGERLVLLRVETEAVTDVGALMPQVGGGAFRYDPLPARMVTQRRRLRFVYYDGSALRPLTLDSVRQLAP